MRLASELGSTHILYLELHPLLHLDIKVYRGARMKH